MARMHSRKHGKSGSKKPAKHRPEWLTYDNEEVENLIRKLAKEGHTSATIGIILRDQYGIPDVRGLGIRLNKVAEKEVKPEVPQDLFNLIKQTVNLHRHMNDNKKDSNSKHGLMLLESKVRRLGKYYARTGKLPKHWRYNIEDAKLLIK
ncbi:MAG: 30S ribosomal protein S15 [Candidatus Aenigmarchaeota archaeon]|nr:30S ribosomal protein S15 [Candidatus Aenigmarchaeota archaeon]